MWFINFIKKASFKCSSYISYMYKRIFQSIRYKIIVLVILAILIPLSLFGAYMYSFIYHNILTQYINDKLEQSLQQINDSLVAKFRIIDNTFNLFLSNQVIRSNLEEFSTSEQSYYLKARTQLEIETQLKYSVIHDYAWNSGLLKSVFVFLDSDNYYYLLYNYLPDDDFLRDHVVFYEASKKVTEGTTVISPASSFNTIYFMRDIETLISRDSIGKLVLSIDESIIFDTYNNIINDKSWKTFIFDNDGIILFHTNRNYIGKKIDDKFISAVNSNSIEELSLDGITYILDSAKIGDMNMTSVIMVPKTEFTSDLNNMILEYLYFIIFAVLFALIIGMFIITNITKPIKDLIINIENVDDGNFKIKMPQYKYSELNEVSNTFNNMIDKIQYLFNEVYKKQILLTESELKALQAQINPHFLFNVLETISWEARMSNNETIYKMTNSLGQLLRANLTFNSREKIRLKEELEYVEFYLYLQKMRFGDKLNINIHVSDNALFDFYLPKLCIQPIVENAVIHGLENKVGKGKLSLLIRRKDETVEFEVIDDGIGFDSSKIDIDCKKDSTIKKGQKHIGLLNVNKRIKLIYGDKYGISIQSRLNAGTKVSICIPLDRGDSKDVPCNDC